MTYTEIFAAYYRLYRAEAIVPTSTDDEYTIGISLANEAISRWETYDNTLWKELFTTLQTSGDGSSTVATGVTDYDAPDDFKWAGGSVKVKDSNGNTQRIYNLIEPQEVQFNSDAAHFAYFTGNPADGYVLHLNPDPDSSISGMSIDYTYYRAATLLATGDDTTEMPNPYFIVHRMLGNRFRASRNPYFNSAIRDAEEVLKIMKMANDSGNWAKPWSVLDRSNSSWGSS